MGGKMTVAKNILSIEKLMDKGLDAVRTQQILKMLGFGGFRSDMIRELRLYCDYLPKAEELCYTENQRYLHFLWDALDKLPVGVVANFAIPFRRMIAERLFKRCGKNFIADENVRFNFGNNIEVGDDVFINRGVFLDSKAGIKIGNSVCITEFVVIFTHSHSESDHAERLYAPVVIEDYAKIYTEAMILPGVTVHKEAIVAAKALVARDVPPRTLVAGIPAKEVRERDTKGRSGKELNHIWFYKGKFQKGG